MILKLIEKSTSSKQRSRILDSVSFLPDKWVISLQYLFKLGRLPSLSNPKTFTEKIQWYKVNYKNPLLVNVIDKIQVVGYVASCGYPEIVKKIYAVYESPHDVDFTSLPESFVLKSNNGGGSRNVVLVRNKSKEDLDKLKEKAIEWFSKRNKSAGREWAYPQISPKVFAEELMPHLDESGIREYQFFCFNGISRYLFLKEGAPDVEEVKKAFFDMNGNMVEIGSEHYTFGGYDGSYSILPSNFQDMKMIAERLAKPFPFMRVDLYNIKGKVVFGEMTFYSGSGYGNYKEFDYKLGDMLVLERY